MIGRCSTGWWREPTCSCRTCPQPPPNEPVCWPANCVPIGHALIACDLSGYGLDGPRSGDKAYDLAIQAEAGVFALNGSPDEMAKVGISIADISAGMYALSSILAALVRRQRTGRRRLDRDLDAGDAGRVGLAADPHRGRHRHGRRRVRCAATR